MTTNQHMEEEDLPTTEYYRWRRKLGVCAMDVDQVEWRYIDNIPFVAAILEVTEDHMPGGSDEHYRASILRRYDSELQGIQTKRLAQALSVDAYIVLWRSGLKVFWVYNFTRRIGWNEMDLEGYEKFLIEKGTPMEGKKSDGK